MSLKENLRIFRKKKGITQAALAREADVSKAYLWQLENEDDKQPSGEKLYRLASALGTNIEKLLGRPLLPKLTRPGPISRHHNCPITPTLAAALALMAESWLRAREHQLSCRMKEAEEAPDHLEESWSFIYNLKQELDEEMKGGKTDLTVGESQ